MVNVGCYVRVSTRESAENGWSIGGQYGEIRNWVDRNRPDWQVVKRYADEGFSASSLDRPALNKMLEDIYLKKIDVVAIWRYDRLSREMLHFQYLLHYLKKFDVDIISISEPAAIDDPAGEFVINLMGLLAQLEKRVTQQRVKCAMYEMARQGKFHGGPTPFGYDYDVETQRLVINSEEAKVVKEIFRLFLEEKNTSKVREKLAELGLVNRSGKSFSTQYIREYIGRRRYIGWMYYSGLTWHDPNIQIIPNDIFERAGELMQENKWLRG